MRTSNPIRKIVDKMIVPPNPDKEKVSDEGLPDSCTDLLTHVIAVPCRPLWL